MNINQQWRRPWVVANWKMNPVTTTETIHLITELNEKLLNQTESLPNVVVAPSFIHLTTVKDLLNASIMDICAQNVCAQNAQKGAFTGEISASQLQNLGVSNVIIGHSERRQYFLENNDVLIEKIRHAFDNNLTVIFCIGETKAQYETQQTQAVLESQLQILENFKQSLQNSLDEAVKPKLLIAYEPVWAIGTGLTPTFDEITNVHHFISEMLGTMQIYAPILYGGSVNAENAKDLARIDLVDGVLVGGASLQATSFYQIIQDFCVKNG